ncbi:MAG: ECF-type sigma factor [Phycisphaerales bacterium]
MDSASDNIAQPSGGDRDLSVLLQAASEGDARAAQAIMPLVYDELRAMAQARLRRARPGATVQATALVHDVYLKLVGRDIQFENRRHFFFAAGRAMRDVLFERARTMDRRHAAQREAIGAHPDPASEPDSSRTLMALEEALPRLQAIDARAHDVVMLRFFAGLDFAQIAETLDVTQRTVERDWRFARSWLYDTLRSDHGLSGIATLVASAEDGRGPEKGG